MHNPWKHCFRQTLNPIWRSCQCLGKLFWVHVLWILTNHFNLCLPNSAGHLGWCVLTKEYGGARVSLWSTYQLIPLLWWLNQQLQWNTDEWREGRAGRGKGMCHMACHLLTKFNLVMPSCRSPSSRNGFALPPLTQPNQWTLLLSTCLLLTLWATCYTMNQTMIHTLTDKSDIVFRFRKPLESSSLAPVWITKKRSTDNLSDTDMLSGKEDESNGM